MNDVRIYIWPDEHGWDKKRVNEIITSFSPFNAKVDKQAAIGGGASGPYPEFNILLEFVKTNYKELLARGFIEAIGANVWNLLRKRLSKVARIKPKAQDLSDYGLGYSVTRAVLYLHIKVGREPFLVDLALDNSKDFDEAFEELPRAIDKAIKSKKVFGRLYWANNKWTAL